MPPENAIAQLFHWEMDSYNNTAMRLAIADVTNPQTTPSVALKQLKYLQNRSSEPPGVVYAIKALVTGSIGNEIKQQAARDNLLHGLETYWKDRFLPSSDYGGHFPR